MAPSISAEVRLDEDCCARPDDVTVAAHINAMSVIIPAFASVETTEIDHTEVTEQIHWASSVFSVLEPP